MNREVHVRFRESLGVKLPRATRLSCAHCEKAVKEAIAQLEGVDSVEVDLSSGQVTVHFSSSAEEEKVVRAIEDAGYSVT